MINLKLLKICKFQVNFLIKFFFNPNISSDISENPLACDCDLLWLSPWSTKMFVKLQPAPKCASPKPFAGTLLKKLKVGTDLHCESPLQPLLELRPEQDQLVFEGDSLTLRCRAPRVAVGSHSDSEDLPATKAHVFWGWSETILIPGSIQNITFHEPTIKFPSITVEPRHLSDSGLLDSILRIPKVTKSHSGMWDCRLSSQLANLSKNIAVVVVSNSTRYCPARETIDNKGNYFWPRTIRGQIVQLSCLGDGSLNAFATQKCDDGGYWIDLDTKQCPFIKESTRILEQFSKVNLSIARGSVLESAKRLRNYTSLDGVEIYKIRDPMDVVFISKTVSNYLDFVSQEKDLGTMLLDIVSQVMTLPGSILQKAQFLSGSCNILVKASEIAATNTPSAQAQKNNLAVELFQVRTDTFSGITCSWFKTEPNEKKLFQCNTASRGGHGFIGYERNIDASIQFPINLFSQTGSSSLISTTQTLLVSVFKNGNFFPQNKTQTNFKISSCVIGAKLTGSNHTNNNLSDPIYITLRAQPFHNELSAPRPVWWDPDMNDGFGGWSLQGCQISHFLNGILIFSCSKLGYYGLVQNLKYLNDFSDENSGAKFRTSPIAFYIGGIFLFTTMWVNIVTYLFYGNYIQMARRTKHSLINTWLAISLLIVAFNIGIYQTENFIICQTFGIVIHYLSLCVLFWMCITVSNMYKRITKNQRNLNMATDEREQPKMEKTILGIYLVGWGISLIICGISGAVNMREYSSYSHCFLRTGPSLSAIFVPAILLTGFISILFICIKCRLRNFIINGHMSEGTQATENVDLDLLETNLPNNICQSISLSTPTTTSNIEDQENSLRSQLKSHLIILILYILTWCSAGIAVAKPFSDKIYYEEEIFSAIHSILSVIFGFFTTFYYGFARSDVRQQWSLLKCCGRCRQKNKRHCVRPKSQINSKEICGPVVAYHTTNTISRSNSQNSKNQFKSIGGDLNSHTLTRNVSPSGHKLSLVHLHRQQFVHNSVQDGGSNNDCGSTTADYFYNPAQINVARKFFRKQKRLAKQNNIDFRQRPINIEDGASDTSSIIMYPTPHSIFSSGSKVNNTNIHIDCKRIDFTAKEQTGHQLNPNILSDSCNESDLIDSDRFVLGAVLAAQQRSKRNNEAIVANIYTNVSETGGKPEHEIITMKRCNMVDDNPFLDTTIEETEEELQDECNNLNIDKNSAQFYSSDFRNIENEENSLEMNTIGIPFGHTIKQQQSNEQNDEEEILLNLERDEEYISAEIEIFNKKIERSKSLDNFCEENFIDNQTKSISCNNINFFDDFHQPTDLEGAVGGLISISNSPILFSPSLCDITDLPQTPILKNKKLTNFISTPLGSELNLYNTNQRNNFTSSPTSESDINYQNSELSIRSHGLYAPQPDNDLNITLTGDDNHFPYQLSEISDFDDDDEDDEIDDENDFNNCSRDLLLHQDDFLNESQTSIDELYQQITRRDNSKRKEYDFNRQDGEESSQCSIVSYVEPNTQKRK